MPDAQGFLLPDPEHVQLVGIRRSQAVLRLVTRRDMPEMYLLRGFEFTHEAVREWEERFAPLLTEHIRRKRKETLQRVPEPSDRTRPPGNKAAILSGAGLWRLARYP